MKCVLAILLLCGVVLAGDVAEPAGAKTKVANPEFWALTGASFAASAADAVTTQQALGRGCEETNWLVGRFPSGAALWASSMGLAAGASGGAYLFKRYMPNKPVLRHFWRVPQALVIGSGTRSAIHNSQVSCGF